MSTAQRVGAVTPLQPTPDRRDLFTQYNSPSIRRVASLKVPQPLQFARLALFCLLLVACAAHAQPARVRSFDFEVHSGGSIHWMSDREIVFKALVQAGKNQKPAYGFNRIGRLAILNTDKGTITWSDESPSRVCVDGNHIAYTQREEISDAKGRRERFWITQGSFGNFKKREVEREDTLDGYRRFDFDYACKFASDLPAPPASLQGKPTKRLRPEHGFVELERDTGSKLEPIYPVRLYAAGRAGAPVAIDALRGEDINLRWPWLPFRNAYWVNQRIRYYPIRPPGTYRSWWLHPDGRVTVAAEFDVAQTFDGLRSWTPAIPVRDGFLATQERGRSTPGLGDLGNSGLYRFDPQGQHEKLAAGTVGPWAVSPNGCRLAVGMDDRQHLSDRFFLKVLHVCKAD